MSMRDQRWYIGKAVTLLNLAEHVEDLPISTDAPTNSNGSLQLAHESL